MLLWNVQLRRHYYFLCFLHFSEKSYFQFVSELTIKHVGKILFLLLKSVQAVQQVDSYFLTSVILSCKLVVAIQWRHEGIGIRQVDVCEIDEQDSCHYVFNGKIYMENKILMTKKHDSTLPGKKIFRLNAKHKNNIENTCLKHSKTCKIQRQHYVPCSHDLFSKIHLTFT